MRPAFAGLDIETTGSAPDSQLIEIGVAIGADVFESVVGWPLDMLNITAKAMKINNIALANIETAPRAYQIDALLAQWLDARVTAGRLLLPVGWNVGTFDMSYVRPLFPHSMKFFHTYRSCDLNAITFMLSDARDIAYDTLKKNAKKYAEENLPVSAKWHRAGYDAQAALLSLRYIQGIL